MHRVLLALLICVLPALTLANTAGPIRDKTAFLSFVQGKELRIGLYNLSLKVTPDGKITGSALGWGISGNWVWQDGYFCRDMDWSGYAIPFNCQLVEAMDASRLRFTSDKGQGQSASFRLR
ncbi:MAG: dihydrodipicolinate reductase [Pseudotabrizicola sp.]|uniref:dihydrodipicolinate reductase n=1 Tax=Pseudotabrizicola sp. TaxID=2939647 RepID=UPI0027286AEF|nr:dihydrodipicolinate reductase [Pseudotabrizicola sp.]MDO8883165.1 dihydrodipicolinate reductase [Pseudotabrizicola sp.]MDP2082417.1 dihydrodipicolinate reductase [Pseudotabrizicola sp.]MDZ7574170.1 dihydrodipicolinate reductase [Pseudotabrizicola sp.]